MYSILGWALGTALPNPSERGIIFFFLQLHPSLQLTFTSAPIFLLECRLLKSNSVPFVFPLFFWNSCFLIPLNTGKCPQLIRLSLPLCGFPVQEKYYLKENLHSHWNMQSNICLKKERLQMFGTECCSFALRSDSAAGEGGSCFLIQAKSIQCGQYTGSITSTPDCRYLPSGLQVMSLTEVGKGCLLPEGFLHCLPCALCYLSPACTCSPMKMAMKQNKAALLLRFY